MVMMGIHRTPGDPRRWDMFFLDDDKFDTEKQRVTMGSDEIIFLPNYEYDEEDKLHIEDYSEMKNYYRVREIEKWMNLAVISALNSKCQKVQRGAIVVRGDTVLGQGYNGLDKKCKECVRKDQHDNKDFGNCKGKHAEGTTVKDAQRIYGDLEGSRLYYVKTRNGKIIPSGDYACTECSGIILGSEIKEVVLWHEDAHLKDEQTVYEPNAFDDVTGDPNSVFLKVGIQTAHFVIYSARKLHELARQYVK